MAAKTPLEAALIEWARAHIEPGQVSVWPLRARAELISDGRFGERGKWIHVHSSHEWVCSVKASLQKGTLTVYVPDGIKVKVGEG